MAFTLPTGLTERGGRVGQGSTIKMKIRMCALVGASFIAATAVAQTPAPVAPVEAPAAAAPIMAGQTDTMLRTGTRVPLRLTQELTTKHKALRVGTTFNMETTEALMLANQVVIPAGTPAVGEIVEVRNKGMWGKSGRFVAQMRYLTYGGRQVRLTGTFDDKGKAGGAGAVAASALVFLPAGFFMTGTSAQLPVGAPVVGFIGEDIPVAFAASGPAPLVVPVAAPAAPAPAPMPAVINASATTTKK